jgi:glycerol-1-phosphate dehydrogenase [NAD(P)+]
VEHVISHMLDMYQVANGKSAGLHGAQVGVGSIVAGELWHRAINENLVDPSRLSLPSLEVAERQVNAAFGDLDDSGALAGECLSDYRKKHERIAQNWGQIETVVTNWAEHATRLKPLVRPGLELRDALIASGSPATFPDLDPPFWSLRVRWAIRNCHLMRNRFNLVDLMNLLGLWDDPTVDALVGMVDGSAWQNPRSSHQSEERQEKG